MEERLEIRKKEQSNMVKVMLILTTLYLVITFAINLIVILMYITTIIIKSVRQKIILISEKPDEFISFQFV